MELPTHAFAGLLYIPLADRGHDFFAFVRRESVRAVRWAGWTHAGPQPAEGAARFVVHRQLVEGESAPWSDNQLEAAGALVMVYNKVRRCAERAVRAAMG